jgi:hypothetical protein
MSDRQWKIGDWCEWHDNRWLVFLERDGFDRVCLVNQNGLVDRAKGDWINKNAIYLPDCTGWDWQPPNPLEPPDGYRLLAPGEIVLATDQFHDGRYGWEVLDKYSKAIGKPWDAREFMPMARKIDRYRPFANAAEFAPHSDKWVMYKGAVSGRSRVVGYGGGFISCREEYSFVSAFINLQFEDGTPFGILDDAKPSGSGSK